MSEAASSLAERLTEAPVAPKGGRGAILFSEFSADVGKQDGTPEFAQLLASERVRNLLSGVFESSPYLTSLIRRDPARLLQCLSGNPETESARLKDVLASELAIAGDTAEAKQALRKYKNAIALLTALADTGGVWPVMTVTRVLSEAADAAVTSAVRYLFHQANVSGQWRSPRIEAPEAGSGFFVLAMGKHGAYELNYSSDIDLIVFFDRDRAHFSGSGDLQSFFVRMTRDLVALLEERTADGYVFRTDLRLRPDAGATQVALSTVAAHGYYETVGQNWERAAMIKARTCAGDITAGEEFLADLVPFVWRKYLDYAAIADVHAMKRQIHAHKGIGGISVLGQNVKLGRGGIREIEFFVQTQQLIAGGRQPDLRVRDTLSALVALQARGWIQAAAVTELEKAYTYLRRLEHRLQMLDDEQTHDMPATQEGLLRVARFSGYEDAGSFSHDLVRVLETVERYYAGLFEDAPELTRAEFEYGVCGRDGRSQHAFGIDEAWILSARTGFGDRA